MRVRQVNVCSIRSGDRIPDPGVRVVTIGIRVVKNSLPTVYGRIAETRRSSKPRTRANRCQNGNREVRFYRR